MRQFKPCSYLPLFKQLNHPLATQRGGIKKRRIITITAFLFARPLFFLLLLLVSPVLQPSSQNLPKSFSQATSAELTQHPHSILLIVLPQMPLFLDNFTWIPLSLHGLKTKWQIWAEHRWRSSTASSSFFNRRTKWSQPVNDWLNKLFFFDFLVLCLIDKFDKFFADPACMSL